MRWAVCFFWLVETRDLTRHGSYLHRYKLLEKRKVANAADRLRLLEAACSTQTHTAAFAMLARMQKQSELVDVLEDRTASTGAIVFPLLCGLADVTPKWWSSLADTCFYEGGTFEQAVVDRIALGLAASALPRVPSFIKRAVSKGRQPAAPTYAAVLQSQLTSGDPRTTVDMVHDLLKCDVSVLAAPPVSVELLVQLCLDTATWLGKE